MQILRPIILSAFLLALNVSAAENFKVAIDECWKSKDHIAMSQCVEALKKQSNLELGMIEKRITLAIEKKDEEPQYLRIMKKNHNDGIRAFKVYRIHECNFAASLAAGGNAAHDLRSACEFQLNSERVNQLKVIESGWYQ